MVFSGGALGVLTSTLCGCFSGGTTGSRVRATRSTSAAAAAAAAAATTAATNNSARSNTRLHRRGRGNNGTEKSNSLGSPWHNVQDKQPTSAPTAS